jgi:serine/threonine protein kinase
MNDAGQPKADKERQFDGVVREYRRRMADGEVVDHERLIASFPHLAEELRAFFESDDFVPPADRKNDSDAPRVGLDTLPPSPLADSVAENRNVTNVTIPERFGKYEIVRLLGRGAMGVVYLANDPQLCRMVALKIPTLNSHTWRK